MTKDIIYVDVYEYDDDTWGFSFEDYDGNGGQMLCAQNGFGSFWELYRQVTVLIYLFRKKTAVALFCLNQPVTDYRIRFILEDADGKKYDFEGFERINDVLTGVNKDLLNPIWKEFNQ